MMSLLFILAPLILFFSVVGLFLGGPPVGRLAYRQFHYLTKGKYDPNNQAMNMLLASMIVKSETDWDIKADGATFPKRKDGAWKIMLSIDSKTQEMTYASYGGNFQKMNPFFQREFKREIIEQLANGARKSFARTLFPEGIQQLRLEAPERIKQRLDLDYNPDSVIAPPAPKQKISAPQADDLYAMMKKEAA